MKRFKSVIIFLFTATIFTSSLKWNIEIGSHFAINLNLTQIFALIIFVALLAISFFFRKSIPVFYKDWFSFFLYAHAVTNLVSSVFFADDKAQSLKSAVVVLMYVAIYQIVRWIAQTENTIQNLVKYLRINNIGSASIGLAAMVVALVTKDGNFGIAMGHVNGEAPSIRSLSFEPNVFAIITAAVLMFGIAGNILNSKKRAADVITTTLLIISILFAYTRSVYISFLFSLVLILYALKRISPKFVFNVLTIIAVVGALIFFTPKNNFIRDAFVSKTTNMFNFQEGNGLERAQIYLIGWYEFLSSPAFGKGTMSANTDVFNLSTGEWQQAMGAKGWLSGALIQSLHDTGVVGALIMISLFVCIIYKNYRCLKQEKDPQTRTILAGFFGGNIIIAVASQLSSVLWIGFPYFYWAVNMAFITTIKNKSKTTNLGINS